MRSWKEVGQLDKAFQEHLVEFVQRTALDPAGMYSYLNPVQPSINVSIPGSRKGSGRNTPVVPQKKENPDQVLRNKVDEADSESEQDRKARLRFGAIGAVKWILETFESDTILSLFGNPAFLTSVQPKQNVPWIDLESFGYGQPAVRRNMWSLLQTLFTTKKEVLQPMASQLSRAVLRSAFVETDSNVQAAMWYPLLVFLKQIPSSWDLETNADQDDDEDDEGEEDKEKAKVAPAAPRPSEAYQEFLQFLQLGCSGSPLQGYPVVVVILSTLSFSVCNFPSQVVDCAKSWFIGDRSIFVVCGGALHLLLGSPGR